jgi:glutamyl-tRNA synthetase
VGFEHLKEPRLTSDELYLESLRPFLEQRFGTVDPQAVARVLPQIRPRAKTLLDAAKSLDWLFAKELPFDEKAKKKFLESERGMHLSALHDLLASVAPFEAAGIETAVKAWAEADGIKLGDIAQPARVAVTGQTSSPGLFEVMELIGKERTLDRLTSAAKLGPSAGA